jgi:hypothetical protein
MVAFQTLFGLGTRRKPTAYNQIRGATDCTSYCGLLKQPDKQESVG